MNRGHLLRLFDEARRLSGHSEFVVIGSLSVLGIDDEPALPPEMSMSIDVDTYTLADPPRILDLRDELGEGSSFHRAHGYYLDAVSPALPTLPDGWQRRLVAIEHEGLRLHFLDPDDAAISKYARGAPNDERWIRAGLLSGHVSLPKLRSRLKDTTFLDQAEEAAVRARVQRDAAWLAERRTGA